MAVEDVQHRGDSCGWISLAGDISGDGAVLDQITPYATAEATSALIDQIDRTA